MGSPEVSVVAGRFVLQGAVAAGGGGQVYKARDRATGGWVALKQMHPGRNPARFEDECHVLARLNHPAIVRYIAHGISRDLGAWLAMEWVDGDSLARRLQGGRLGFEEALEWLQAIASGLAAVHESGIVHRDIKPGNVLLMAHQSGVSGLGGAPIKIVDFGTAIGGFARRAITLTGNVVGTPAYMAPEQVRGARDIDARADVFALGCIAYECLVGHPLFIAKGPVATFAKILFEEPPLLEELARHFPRALVELIVRMVAKDRQQRPDNAGAVAAALHAIATGFGLETAPKSSLPLRRLGLRERRFVTMIIARSPEGRPDINATLDADDESVSTAAGSLLARFGAKLEWTAPGVLCALLTGADAKEQLTRAAHVALEVRALSPGSRVALATGRDEDGAIAGVIDHAYQLLSQSGEGGAIRIDDVSSTLLAERFVLSSDGANLEAVRDSATAPRKRMLLGRFTPFVGRERELRLLQTIVDDMHGESVARVALIVAPAGMGKSRLLAELSQEILVAKPMRRPWTVSCNSLFAGSPLSLCAELVRTTAGIFANDDASLAQQKLLRHLRRSVDSKDLTRIGAFLGELIGCPFPSDTTPELTAASREKAIAHDLVQRSFVEWIDAEASKGPIAIAIEDLHWGDPASVRLMDLVLRAVREKPVLVIATARPEVRERFPRLWESHAMDVLRLGELSRQASERLVASVLGESASPKTVTHIAERAAGNAFFIEELIRWVAAGQSDTLPETVLATVELRLETLPSDARHALRGASIFGETFWRGGLAAMVHTVAAGLLDDVLRTLEELELIVRRPESRFRGEEEYAFRHALVRDGAYAGLTADDRRLGHRIVAEWLTSAGERDARIVAEHFEQAGEHTSAVTWYYRAALAALASDMQASIDASNRAIGCGAAGEVLGEILYLQSEAQFYLGALAEANQCVHAAASLLPRGSPSWCTSVAGIVIIGAQAGDFSSVMPLCEDLIATEPQARAYVDYARAMVSNQHIQHATGRPSLARRMLSRVLDVACQAPNDAAVQASAAVGQALAARMLEGNPWAAIVAAERARDLCEQVGYAGHGAWITRELAWAYLVTGEPERAEHLLRQEGGRAKERRLSLFVPMLEAHLAWSMAARREKGAAQELARAASASGDKLGDRVFGGAAWTGASRALLLADDLDGARAVAEAALPRVTGAVYRSVLLAILARVALAQKTGNAVDHAREAWRCLADEGSTGWDEAFIALTLRDVLRADGQREEADRIARVARSPIVQRGERAPNERARLGWLETPDHAELLASED